MCPGTGREVSGLAGDLRPTSGLADGERRVVVSGGGGTHAGPVSTGTGDDQRAGRSGPHCPGN